MKISLQFLCLSVLILTALACESSSAKNKKNEKASMSSLTGSWKINKPPCNLLSFIKKDSILTLHKNGGMKLSTANSNTARIIASGKWTLSQPEANPILTLRFLKVNYKKLADKTFTYITGFVTMTNSSRNFSVEFYCAANQFLCYAPRTKPIYLKAEKL